MVFPIVFLLFCDLKIPKQGIKMQIFYLNGLCRLLKKWAPPFQVTFKCPPSPWGDNCHWRFVTWILGKSMKHENAHMFCKRAHELAHQCSIVLHCVHCEMFAVISFLGGGLRAIWHGNHAFYWHIDCYCVRTRR